MSAARPKYPASSPAPEAVDLCSNVSPLAATFPGTLASDRQKAEDDKCHARRLGNDGEGILEQLVVAGARASAADLSKKAAVSRKIKIDQGRVSTFKFVIVERGGARTIGNAVTCGVEERS